MLLNCDRISSPRVNFVLSLTAQQRSADLPVDRIFDNLRFVAAEVMRTAAPLNPYLPSLVAGDIPN